MPEDRHTTLKARAAARGMSVSEYLLKPATEPTLNLRELSARIRSRPKVRLGRPAAEFLHEAREERERELDARR
jgi:hypothetical protein